jgi:hypothetical protein
MKRIAPEIYGGALRENPELIGMHAENIEEPPIWAISTNYWLWPERLAVGATPKNW